MGIGRAPNPAWGKAAVVKSPIIAHELADFFENCTGFLHPIEFQRANPVERILGGKPDRQTPTCADSL
jgi:hypothetical protein